MERLHETEIIQFQPNALYDVRKEYGLHEPGRMAEAVDIIEKWVQQQNHFLKKDFPRYYLESTILNCKGSIERSKSRLDKSCTLRTISPQFFGDFDIKNDFKQLLTNNMQLGIIPMQTKSLHRVAIVKNMGDFDPKTFDDYHKFMIYMLEYMKIHDCGTGFICVCEFMDLNLMEYIKALNIAESRQLLNLVIEGYGFRIKAIHFVTPSKLIEMLVGIVKSIMSEKIGERVYVHKTMDTVYEHVPKEIMPKEYGGNEKPLKELHEKMIDEISKPEFREHIREINKACTDETKRQADTFNEQYLGMPGTFRKINVD